MLKNLEKWAVLPSVLLLFVLGGWILWEVIPPSPGQVQRTVITPQFGRIVIFYPTAVPAVRAVVGPTSPAPTPVYFVRDGKYMGSVTYNSGSGTFVVPAFVTTITVTVIGGGAGGCGGNAQYVPGGGGGGCAVKTYSVTPGDSFSYSVGAGGPGDFGNTGATGGGASTFDTVTANGGSGGSAGPGGDTVGTGGTASGGDVNYTGGDGGHGSGFTQAGGGGSSAGPTSPGNNAVGGTGGIAPSGGAAGGDGGSGTAASGNPGLSPGGGGGGNTNNNFNTGNSGGPGQITVTWPFVDGPVGSSDNPAGNWWRYINPRSWSNDWQPLIYPRPLLPVVVRAAYAAAKFCTSVF